MAATLTSLLFPAMLRNSFSFKTARPSLQQDGEEVVHSSASNKPAAAIPEITLTAQSTVEMIQDIINQLQPHLPQPGPQCLATAFILAVNTQWEVRWCSARLFGKMSGRDPPCSVEGMLVVRHERDPVPVIVDFNFRARFHPVRCPNDIEAILKSLPTVAVSSLADLRPMVQTGANAAKVVFNELGMPVPPWRRESSMMQVYTACVSEATRTCNFLETEEFNCILAGKWKARTDKSYQTEHINEELFQALGAIIHSRPTILEGRRRPKSSPRMRLDLPEHTTRDDDDEDDALSPISAVPTEDCALDCTHDSMQSTGWQTATPRSGRRHCNSSTSSDRGFLYEESPGWKKQTSGSHTSDLKRSFTSQQQSLSLPTGTLYQAQMAAVDAGHVAVAELNERQQRDAEEDAMLFMKVPFDETAVCAPRWSALSTAIHSSCLEAILNRRH